MRYDDAADKKTPKNLTPWSEECAVTSRGPSGEKFERLCLLLECWKSSSPGGVFRLRVAVRSDLLGGVGSTSDKDEKGEVLQYLGVCQLLVLVA
ncbi:hypothetical protein F2P81_009476 [Scophthalmus maximus]|uniref:Uncharacterized protein n=1 Tax=Scophthalmus maximus TaxID=52904 RepID=A0A6A4TA00_SCOMX|nr:hypothetical protein F2P81_009476 [Scophthalmus maximus]